MPEQALYKDDAQLLPLIADGRQDAMRMLFEQYYPRLYYFAFKLIRDETEAQDQAQEALTTLWQKKEEFRRASLSQAEAFLFTVVKNRCYNYSRRRRMKAGKEDDIAAGQDFSENIIEARLIQEDVFNLIFREIEQLPPQQVQLLKMIYVEGLQTDEIADRMGITLNVVRNQKARALEKLRTLLLKKGLLHLLILFFY